MGLQKNDVENIGISLTSHSPSVTLLLPSGERRRAYEPVRKQNQCGGGKRKLAGRAKSVNYSRK